MSGIIHNTRMRESITDHCKFYEVLSVARPFLTARIFIHPAFREEKQSGEALDLKSLRQRWISSDVDLRYVFVCAYFH